jgi:hypothetical protein
MVWGAYYSVGKAVITRVDEKSGGVLEVSGAPELPIQSLRVLSGFALQALEMAGAQNVSCQLNTENPQAWQWTFRWNA